MNEQATAQVEEKGREKKGQGSFRISEDALNILIKSKATAWQIGVYLTIARFTDGSGKFSTAGYDAIYRYTAASPGSPQKPGPGRQHVEQLLKMGKQTSPLPSAAQAPSARRKGHKVAQPPVSPSLPTKLLYAPEDWQRMTGETIPETPNKLYPVKWILNDFGGEKWTWFPNELVDGQGRFRQPLLRLKRCGDIAARLLLFLYNRNNMEEFGGIPPFPNVYRKYTLEHLKTALDCTFWRAVEGTHYLNDDLSLAALGSHYWSIEEKKNFVTNALFSLLSQGFLAEVVTVMDRDPSDLDARPMYELHYKAKGFQMAPREDGLAGRIDRIFSKVCGKGMADEAGRFYNKFPVLNSIGMRPHVAGIYRPRFQILNPKNYTILSSWKRRAMDKDMMLELLNYLEQKLGIASESPDYRREADPDYQREAVWN